MTKALCKMTDEEISEVLESGKLDGRALDVDEIIEAAEFYCDSVCLTGEVAMDVLTDRKMAKRRLGW